MAVHTRIGAGPDGASRNKGGDASGYFAPRISGEEDASVIECPSWTLIARSLGTAIELIAIPGRSSSDTDSKEQYYLRGFIQMPEGAEVTNIAFYGDNGISSLSPKLNDDAQPIKEGRQSLALVVKCTDSQTPEMKEELWAFKYDDIPFRKFDLKRSHLKNEVIISAAEFELSECASLMNVQDEGYNDDENVIVPKSEFNFCQVHNFIFTFMMPFS